MIAKAIRGVIRQISKLIKVINIHFLRLDYSIGVMHTVATEHTAKTLQDPLWENGAPIPGRLGKSSEGPFDCSYQSRIFLAWLVSFEHCKDLQNKNYRQQIPCSVRKWPFRQVSITLLPGSINQYFKAKNIFCIFVLGFAKACNRKSQSGKGKKCL